MPASGLVPDPGRVGVVGAGSVGCYVGGALATVLDVTLVGRERQREAMDKRGLVAVPLAGDRRIAPGGSFRFESELSTLADCQVVMVSVKSGQTGEVARELAGVVADDTLIVSLQNGVRNAERLREHLGHVAAAIVSFNVVFEDGNVARQTTSGPLIIEDTGSRCAQLVAALEAAGVESELDPRIARRQWTKLVINLSNSISALSGAPTAEIIASAGYRRVVAATTSEALDVLAAADIKPATMRGVPLRLMATMLRLPTPIVKVAMRAQMKVDPRARSSMWQDLDRRRATEIDFLNGEIVALAERHGHDAPINARLVELVHQAEARSEGSPNMSADELRAALAI